MEMSSKCDQLMFVSRIDECAHNVVIRAVEGINKCGLGKTEQMLDEPDSLMDCSWATVPRWHRQLWSLQKRSLIGLYNKVT